MKNKFVLSLICLLTAMSLLVQCDAIKDNKNYYNEKNVEKSVVFDGVEYKMGWLPVSEERYKSFSKDFAEVSAPVKTFVDLSSNMPNVGNQGRQGSCVAWATGYAYKTFQEKLDRGWSVKNQTSHQFSPAYIYNQINNGQDEGSYIHDAMNLLVKQGCATLSVMPYNQNDYQTKPNASQKKAAYQYRAVKWSSLSYGSVNAIKQRLADGDCVVVGIPVYPDFNVSLTNPIYDNIKGKLLGYHAITFVGYDDNKQAFKLINSWGERWGFNGYGWMSYNLVSMLNVRGYVMTDFKNGNLALGKSASASSSYNKNFSPSKAVDGNKKTRWIARSTVSKTWFKVSLGREYPVKSIIMRWSNKQYPLSYVPFTKVGNGNWKKYSPIASNGGIDHLRFNSAFQATTLFLRLRRSKGSYYYLYEFEVYSGLVKRPGFYKTPSETYKNMILESDESIMLDSGEELDDYESEKLNEELENSKSYDLNEDFDKYEAGELDGELPLY